jgi:hypothetical protein
MLALAVCASIGLHWAALQTVAWTQMLVTYSQNAALGEAVKKTFDGEHPCELCRLVQHGQNEEKKQDSAPLTKKLDAVLVIRDVAPSRFGHSIDFPMAKQCAAGWSEAPKVPPPRA